MDRVLERLGEIGIIPVIQLDSAQAAVGLGHALVQGGIPAAEVTFRTAAAEAAIAAMAAQVPDLLVGAGTVLTVDQATRAVRAGARFLVSPCYVDEVVAYGRSQGIPVLPAVTNPDGVARGLAQGLEVLKFFPAGASGGTATLDALAGPFGTMAFVPTGGINAANLADYARRPNVLAVGGSWMVKPGLVASGDWATVTRLCREAVAALHGFAFAHLGINTPAEQTCRDLAGTFARLFALPCREGRNSIFAGDRIEITKQPFPGEQGHIAISCNQVQRAVAYFAAAGIAARPETAKLAKGRCKAIYLDLELGGFAVHLVQA
ncbi:MAG: bifunctional 4-hydroxy-2-oxoglutarate aldolase/2-dehydro-3-deoxy-phosphogluconate aldolase [Holophaga sp.]|nr:bifunctional 4-hydroxy-2-oxoglutarate aldolase/2-dehydro-3-deoxy-phosphogluconate aldolase [Holophaga sp.]